jgi:heme exporter protein A
MSVSYPEREWHRAMVPDRVRIVPAPRLRFDGLRRGFGELAVLQGVSGGAAAGQALLVTGPNGSGKSTLLRCLAGLLSLDGGTIDYREDGDLAMDAAVRRNRVGFLSPDVTFYSELTVGENLTFFARLRRVDPARGQALLDRLNLPADRRAGALSSGMRQRLRWAFALLHRPLLLLLDEPFQNFDTAGEQAARGLLAEHLATGLAVVANPGGIDLDHVAERIDLGR